MLRVRLSDVEGHYRRQTEKPPTTRDGGETQRTARSSRRSPPTAKTPLAASGTLKSARLAAVAQLAEAARLGQANNNNTNSSVPHAALVSI
jgi:hypothetical protein